MKLLMAIASSVAATALALSLAAFIIADRAESSAAPDGRAPGGGSTSPIAGSTAIEVELGDVYIKPQQLTAPEGEVVLNVKNAGAIQHDLMVEGVGGTALLNPGAGESLALGALEPGTYTIYCTVPGHREGGMQGTLTVGEGGDHVSHGGGRMLHNDDDYMAGVLAFPAETEGLGGQIMEPVMDGDVKVFELTAEEIQWEVEPGVFKDAMAYNGQVPGPEIRVQLGDRVRIVFHNELPESSAVHFHGLVLPNSEDGVPGLTQPLVLPGESWTYEFDIRNTGSHMYHSHMNGSVQIPMGLLGAFIVEDEVGGPVDQEFTMILNDGPLGYTINGKGFPATQPVVAQRGERIRIRYMNEGLQIHPMHLHGIPQLVVAKDGYELPTPHWEDTVTVAPGERVDVIVDATELGLWAFHCHILTHAEGPNGMFGMVTAMVVNE